MPRTPKVAGSGRMYATPDDATRAAVASAARTTTANGTPFDIEDAIAISGTLAITARSGTSPTLDVKLQESFDGGTTWVDVGSFPQQTNVGTVQKTFGPVTPGNVGRWVWTIGGTTPSFTFTVSAQGIRALQ